MVFGTLCIPASPRNKKTRFPRSPLVAWSIPFPWKGLPAGRRASGRKERTNRWDQNWRFPERNRVVLAFPGDGAPGKTSRKHLRNEPWTRAGWTTTLVENGRTGRRKERGKGYAGTDKPENRSRGHAAGHSRVRPLIRKAEVLDARRDAASIIPSAIGTSEK